MDNSNPETPHALGLYILRPATSIHYFTHRAPTPSAECHQNSSQQKLVAMATSLEKSKSNKQQQIIIIAFRAAAAQQPTRLNNVPR